MSDFVCIEAWTRANTGHDPDAKTVRLELAWNMGDRKRVLIRGHFQRVPGS